MERAIFAGRFAAAAERARTFASTLVLETLPAEILLRPRLNRSYADAVLRPGEVSYPEDGSYEQDFDLRRCDLQQAVSVLWRDGRVPEWINLAAVDRDESATLIEAVCCGRFSSDDELLYRQSGPPPFHILGPPLPPGHQGERYSLHRQAECWDRSDLAHLSDIDGLVWLLRICTDDFDSRALTELPSLAGMQILEHRRCSISGDPVGAVMRFPSLRTVRIHFTAAARPAIRGDPASATVAKLMLTNLPAEPWGFANLARALPVARAIDLTGSGRLRLDGEFGSRVRRVSLRAQQLDELARLPEELDSLAIHLNQAGDDLLNALLDGVRSVRVLHLRGTPLTDHLAVTLSERPGLEYLDVVDTGVSTEAIERIAAAHPRLRLLPSLASRNRQ